MAFSLKNGVAKNREEDGRKEISKWNDQTKNVFCRYILPTTPFCQQKSKGQSNIADAKAKVIKFFLCSLQGNKDGQHWPILEHLTINCKVSVCACMCV